MTPMQRVGLKVGDKILVIEPNGHIKGGEVITITRDDGSKSPPVKCEKGKGFYNILDRKWEKVIKKELKAMKFWIGTDEPELYAKVCDLLDGMGYSANPNIKANTCSIIAYRNGEYAAWGYSLESFKEDCSGEEINVDWMREEHIELESKIVEVVVNRLQVHFSIEEPKEYEPKVGDFVTVVRWINETDKSYIGSVMEIKAIDHPFVIVKPHDRYACVAIRTLDLNRVEIRPVTTAFRLAAMGSS